MKRLTKRDGDGFAPNHDNCPKQGDCYDSADCVSVLVDRLAAYEDAEEKGLLWPLPCKPGDTVMAYLDCPTLILSECIITRIEHSTDYKEPLFTAVCYAEAKYNTFWLSDFGKEIFTLDQYYTMTAKATRKGEKRTC